jgi:hypothetical protein
MSRVQPQTLTNEELLHHIHTQNYNVSVDFVKELYERFTDMQVIAQSTPDMGIDPRQLELPL